MVLNCLEVDSDSQWCAKFIVSGIAFANRCRGVVHPVGDTGRSKFMGYFGDVWNEIFIR